jgi:lipoprotein signal peptidase
MAKQFLKIGYEPFLGLIKQFSKPGPMPWIGLTLIFITIDQLSKLAASQFNWPIFFNDQFAFSLPLPTAVMFVIYVSVLAGMSVYVYRGWKQFNLLQRSAWVLVYAGGLSNIGERLVLGHVRDFIPIANGWLNFADCYLLVGLMLLLASTRYKSSEKV